MKHGQLSTGAGINMVNLDYFISEAFDIQMFQVVGAPKWVHDERWDIEAQPPEGSKASKANPKLRKLPPNADQRMMMQSLLSNRFREFGSGAVERKARLPSSPSSDAVSCGNEPEQVWRKRERAASVWHSPLSCGVIVGAVYPFRHPARCVCGFSLPYSITVLVRRFL